MRIVQNDSPNQAAALDREQRPSERELYYDSDPGWRVQRKKMKVPVAKKGQKKKRGALKKAVEAQ